MVLSFVLVIPLFPFGKHTMLATEFSFLWIGCTMKNEWPFYIMILLLLASKMTTVQSWSLLDCSMWRHRLKQHLLRICFFLSLLLSLHSFNVRRNKKRLSIMRIDCASNFQFQSFWTYLRWGYHCASVWFLCVIQSPTENEITGRLRFLEMKPRFLFLKNGIKSFSLRHPRRVLSISSFAASSFF